MKTRLCEHTQVILAFPWSYNLLLELSLSSTRIGIWEKILIAALSEKEICSSPPPPQIMWNTPLFKMCQIVWAWPSSSSFLESPIPRRTHSHSSFLLSFAVAATSRTRGWRSRYTPLFANTHTHTQHINLGPAHILFAFPSTCPMVYHPHKATETGPI